MSCVMTHDPVVFGRQPLVALAASEKQRFGAEANLANEIAKIELQDESQPLKKKKFNLDKPKATPAPTPPAPDEDTRAEQINKEHALVGKAILTSILHAKRAGELLSDEKDDTPHGEWSEWLEDNFDGSATTARGYIRIAKGWSVVEAWIKSNRQCVADLTLGGALRLLAKPKQEREPDDGADGAHSPQPQHCTCPPISFADAAFAAVEALVTLRQSIPPHDYCFGGYDVEFLGDIHQELAFTLAYVEVLVAAWTGNSLSNVDGMSATTHERGRREAMEGQNQ